MVNWVDIVGDNVVASLAKQTNVTLTSGIVALLEKFGECVERESRTRRLRLQRGRRIQSELHHAYNVVKDEVGALRESILNGRLNDPRSFFVRRHSETYLPIVHLKLKSFPEMIVHVNRTYATERKGVTFGLRTYEYCGGRLTGPVAQAANFVTEQCKKVDWQLSVSDVLTFWIQVVTSIPPEERSASEKAHQRKRPLLPTRKHRRWKARKISDLCSSTNNSEKGSTLGNELAKLDKQNDVPSNKEQAMPEISTNDVSTNGEENPPEVNARSPKTPEPEEGATEASIQEHGKNVERTAIAEKSADEVVEAD